MNGGEFILGGGGFVWVMVDGGGFILYDNGWCHNL